MKVALIHKKLNAYSTFTATYLIGNVSVDAQAVYVDIEPDTILQSGIIEGIEGEVYNIDIDFDSITDFQLANFDWTWSFSSYGGDLYQQIVEVLPFGDRNFIACYSGYFNYLAFALEQNFYIDHNLNFNKNSQLMAYRKIPLELSFYWVIDGGYWYPETTDHYLGIKFKEDDVCIHYGWIRCDVLDEGRVLIVKDYAYESKCNVGIYAGDTIGNTIEFDYDKGDFGTVISGNVQQDGITVYSFNTDLYILLQNFNSPYPVSVINILGETVYTGELKEKQNKISLAAFSKGYYLVEISTDEGSLTKKIMIN